MRRIMMTVLLLGIVAPALAQVPMPRPRPAAADMERKYFDFCAHNPANCKPQNNVAQQLNCVAQQVCSTCYTPDGHSYTCNCHTEYVGCTR
jgi:hypothetical protein